tara:strand:+ start:239 stop:409 length:171 start_codon:yes stop_codon:yes gene_type:complete
MFNAKSQRGAFGARDRSPEDLFKLDLKNLMAEGRILELMSQNEKDSFQGRRITSRL